MSSAAIGLDFEPHFEAEPPRLTVVHGGGRLAVAPLTHQVGRFIGDAWSAVQGALERPVAIVQSITNAVETVVSWPVAEAIIYSGARATELAERSVGGHHDRVA